MVHITLPMWATMWKLWRKYEILFCNTVILLCGIANVITGTVWHIIAPEVPLHYSYYRGSGFFPGIPVAIAAPVAIWFWENHRRSLWPFVSFYVLVFLLSTSQAVLVYFATKVVGWPFEGCLFDNERFNCPMNVIILLRCIYAWAAINSTGAVISILGCYFACVAYKKESKVASARDENQLSTPVQYPVHAPVQGPLHNSEQYPVWQYPLQAPLRDPIQTTVKAPVQTPVQYSEQYPVHAPVKAPVHRTVKTTDDSGQEHDLGLVKAHKQLSISLV